MSRTTSFNPMFPGTPVPPMVAPGAEVLSPGSCCFRPQCPTIYQKCPPIVSCSKQVLDQYHITKQPYIHNFHTEVVHHHIHENEFIPQFSCSEVHVTQPPRPMTFGPAPMGPAPFVPGSQGVMPQTPGPMMF